MLDVRCMSILEAIETCQDQSINVAFLDPPYNTGNEKDKTVKYSQNKNLASKNWSNFQATWDTIANYDEWATEWMEALQSKMNPQGAVFVCGSYHNIPEIGVIAKRLGYYIVTQIAWCIPNAMPNLACTEMVHATQFILWLRPQMKKRHFYDKEASKRHNEGKNLRDYWPINNDTTSGRGMAWRKHKSKKPVALVQRAIDITLPKESGVTVVDFFAGSGTTGVAVQNLERQYGIQIGGVLSDRDEGYIAAVNERLAVPTMPL